MGISSELAVCNATSVTKCMCAWGGRYVGQINTTDFFTRLLCGIAYTGIAPESFYTSANGKRPHFDGTPVDMVSGVIAATLAHERSGIATYHMVNPHYSDGISLDTIAAWLVSAGIKVALHSCSTSPAESSQCSCGAVDLPYSSIAWPHRPLKGLGTQAWTKSLIVIAVLPAGLGHCTQVYNMSCGPVKVETVAPYERWYERFKGALESLKSRQQQQHSPLPIIYQWQRPQPAHSAPECALL